MSSATHSPLGARHIASISQTSGASVNMNLEDRLRPCHPAPFRTDGSNPFARHSMAVRVPKILEETLERNPDYTSEIVTEIRKLKDEIENDAPIRLFSPPAADYDLWTAEFANHEGDSWLDTEWFFAEMLAYRRLLEACRYWTTLRDPFAPAKQKELASEQLWTVVAVALEQGGPLDERLATNLSYSLWGNRVDLSIKESAAMGTAASDDHLLVSDIPAVVSHLLGIRDGSIHFFADNAGTELALDLALADLMLTNRVADRVIMHVKMQPVLVSDAIVQDVHMLVDRMAGRTSDTRQLARRVTSYLEYGRLSLVPDFFWGTARRLWQLPTRLTEPLRSASLVIAKGDLNYRRATNDALWPPEALFADAVHNFKAPLLALRTLKCDALVGVDARTQQRMDQSENPDWRTSGAYGVAQFAP